MHTDAIRTKLHGTPKQTALGNKNLPLLFFLQSPGLIQKLAFRSRNQPQSGLDTHEPCHSSADDRMVRPATVAHIASSLHIFKIQAFQALEMVE